MIRAGRWAAALAAVAATAAVAAVPAQAAAGTLVVNGTKFRNPAGCYNGPVVPLVVGNHTTRPVVVFPERGCRGRAIAVLASRVEMAYEFGQSVRVP